MMENFENHFKDNLQDIDELPPSDGWQRISGALDKEGRRHTYVWVAILLLICLSADSVIDREPTAEDATATSGFSIDSFNELSACLPLEQSSGRFYDSASDYSLTLSGVQLNRSIDDGNLSSIPEDDKMPGELVQRNKGQTRSKFTPGIVALQAQQAVQLLGGVTSNTTAHSNVLNFDDCTSQIVKGESIALLPSSITHLHDDGVTTDGQLSNAHIENEGSTSGKATTSSVGDEHDSSRLVTLIPKEVIKGKDEDKDKDKEGSSEKKRLRKWYYQANIGLNYTMKKINPSEDIYYMARLNDANQFTLKNAGYQLSLRMRREFNHKYIFIAGASYSWLRETTNFDYYNIIADSLVIGNVSETEIQVQTYSPVRNNVVENSVSYGGITLGVMRKINLLRVEQSIFFEGRYNRVLSHSHNTQDRDHRFLPNPNQLFIKAGLEKCFKIHPKYVLSVAPFAQYSLGSIYGQESLYSLRPIQIGLDLGVVIAR